MRSRHVTVSPTARALIWVLAAAALTVQPLRGQEPAASPTAPPAVPPAEAPAAPSPVAGQEGEIDALLAQVRERFEARPLRCGVLLSPKYAPASVGDIEVSGGTISIGGRAATGSEVESLLGAADAGLVIRLSYVRPEDLVRRLAAAPAAPPGAPGPAPTGVIARADTAGAPVAPAAPPAPSEPLTPPEPAEPPEPPEPPVGDQVRMGDDITIAKDQTVLGDVVAIGGDVEVHGQVLGDVVSVGGVLRLYDTARVNGDAVAVGGRLEKDPGAQVLGQTTTVGIQMPFVMGPHFAWEGGGPLEALGALLLTLLCIALLLILGAICQLVAGRNVDRMETNLRSSPLKAGLVGFLAQVLFLPVYVIGLVLLVITIIGIPIAVLWAVGFFVLGFVAHLFGFTAAARAAGDSMMRRLNRPLASPHVTLLMGLIALFSPLLVHNLFHFGPGIMDLFAMLFAIVGIVVLYVASTIGFGAAILTRFGTRTTWSGEPPAGLGAPAAPSPPSPPPPPTEPFPEPAYRSLPKPPGALPGERGMPDRPLLASAPDDATRDAAGGNETFPPV